MSLSLITPDRLQTLRQAVCDTASLPGDMAELGVYRGGSAIEIASACPHKLLHMFDTFAGMPADEQPEYDADGYVHKGDFSCDMDEVLKNVLGHGNFMLWQGLFPASALGVEKAETFSFVHVDCDLYQSAKDAVAFFWPRLPVGGIMLFDDYNCKFTGVTQAVREAFPLEDIVEHEYANGIKIGCQVRKVKP